MTVKRVQGRVSPVLEVTYEDGKKVLNAGNVNYSFGALHDVFRIALKKAEIEKLQPKEVLILGFGVGSIASIIVEEMKIPAKMVGVEADEEVIELAEKEFDISRVPFLAIVHDKAEHFISSTERKFDLVAVDVFVEANVPEACKTEKFLSAMYDHLNSGGCVVFNEMPGENLAANDAFVDRFRKAFDTSEIHHVQLGGEVNRILVGRRK